MTQPIVGQPVPQPPPQPPLVRAGAAAGDTASRIIQNQLSGGAAGNTQIYRNGTGGVVIQPGRNQLGDFFHSVTTNPIISPFGSLLDRISR